MTSYMDAERWSRGCGSGGVGPSGHIAGDGYRGGVLEGNYIENKADKDLHSTGRSTYNYGAAPRGASTQRESFNPHGKVGEDLLYISQRQDRELTNLGQKPDILMRHGSYLAPPMDASTSLYSLTHGEKQVEEPAVQAYLWDGSNTHNKTVPLKVSALGLTHKKVDQWKQEHDPYGAYKTSSRTQSLSAALPAAENPSKTGTIKTITDAGQVAQLGRKPVGPNQQECEKNYRKLGLRDTYCTFLTAPKH